MEIIDISLQEFDKIPEGLLDSEPNELLDLLGGPSLIKLKGKNEPALFVSVLIHGNEHTGFLAIKKLLKHYRDKDKALPRSLNLFIGNVHAAKHNLRMLEDHYDYNRVWNSENLPGLDFVKKVKEIVTRDGIFATVDIHNNTGKNPHYACVSSLKPSYLQLSELFGRTSVYFKKPDQALSVVMTQFAPSLTLECGISGVQRGTDHACEFVNDILNLSEIPNHPVRQQDLDLYETFARIQMKPGINFKFENEEQISEKIFDLTLCPKIEVLNFVQSSTETIIGYSKKPVNELFEIIDNNYRNITDQYLTNIKGEITFLQPVIPSMFTLDKKVIQQDCLGYIMRFKEWNSNDHSSENN